MFHQARKEMRDGDWFLRVDADEFHHVDPREFVKQHMRKHETIAYHQYYDFCLLESEVVAWQAGKETIEDRVRAIDERRRWYTVSLYSEPRLCRFRSSMQWPPSVSFPFNAGFVARERLPIRHYPHRDPVQLQKRCKLRAIIMGDAENRSNWTAPELHHWSEKEWRNFVRRDGDPDLIYWRPGTDLPNPKFRGHLAKPHIRLLQRIAHSWFLPMLDRRRQRWPDDMYPQRIPGAVTSRLKSELGS
jgi:hypothetical protein